MGDLINLNKVRKARARQEAEGTAAANRVRFGRTGAEKARARAESDRDARRHEGHALGAEGRTGDGAPDRDGG
ncbi:MAG: DUF4169 family protein [Rhodospirillales bacterium]|jgi:hypothetical protein